MIYFSFYFLQRKLDSKECGVVYCIYTELTFSCLVDSSILFLNVYCPIPVQNQPQSIQRNRVHGSWYVMFCCMLVSFDSTHIPLVYFTGTRAVKRCHCSILYNYILRGSLAPRQSFDRTSASEAILNRSWWRHQMETFSALLALCGPRWIPHTKVSDAELWCFLWSAPE